MSAKDDKREVAGVARPALGASVPARLKDYGLH